MGRKARTAALCAVLCGYIVLSQHRDLSGDFWYRTEVGPVSAEECRAILKRVTTRSRVGFTKWYAMTPQQLETLWGRAATVDNGTWIACWAEGSETYLGVPDS